jgi:hypothetical protein
MICAVCDPDPTERFKRTLATLHPRHPRIRERKLNVGECAHPGNQIEALKHEPQLAVANIPQLDLIELTHVKPIKSVHPARGKVKGTPGCASACSSRSRTRQ